MLSPLKYLEKLEARTLELLEQDSDPQAAMAMLDEAAIEGGLTQATSPQSSPATFAASLLSDNPMALDWISAKRDAEAWTLHPDRFESLDEIVSAMRPSPN